jgi:hypothetical protein
MCFSFCFGRAEFPDMDADFLQRNFKSSDFDEYSGGSRFGGSFCTGKVFSGFSLKIQLDLCGFFLCGWFCDKYFLVLPLTHNIHIDANTTG